MSDHYLTRATWLSPPVGATSPTLPANKSAPAIGPAGPRWEAGGLPVPCPQRTSTDALAPQLSGAKPQRGLRPCVRGRPSAPVAEKVQHRACPSHQPAQPEPLRCPCWETMVSATLQKGTYRMLDI